MAKLSNQVSGKRIATSAMAGILAVSMTPGLALADDAADQNQNPASEESQLADPDSATPTVDGSASDPAAEDALDTSNTDNTASDPIVSEADDESVEPEGVEEDEEESSDDAAETDGEALDVNAPEDEEESEEGTAAESASTFTLPGTVSTLEANPEEAVLVDGVNSINASIPATESKTYNVTDGKVLVIAGSDDPDNPVVIENCVFNLTGTTMYFRNSLGIGYTGESLARLAIGKNVVFKNCRFITPSGSSATKGGNDACISLFGGNAQFDDCEIAGTGFMGQFMGLYGSAVATFNGSNISTVGNTGGWSYAMYGSSILNLNNSSMSATGMQRKPGGGNVNAFYSGDLNTEYDAININNSTIDFSDNWGGGFAINNVNIHVNNNSVIKVTDNAGNACNSGYWIVDNSEIDMSGNKGHGLSCIGIEMDGGSLNIEHNGCAGLYIQSRDSILKNAKVNIRCNGERLLSYSAGDVWLNAHKLTLEKCDDAWLGAIGRKGILEATNCTNLIACDLVNNHLKSKTETIIGEDVELSGQDEHYLFLNPPLDFDYARANTEGGTLNSNDSDLFDQLVKDDEGNLVQIDPSAIIGGDSAKIGTMTTAQLSHHDYDWDNGEVTGEASPDAYGVMRYSCKDACADYATDGYGKEHQYGCTCNGTYVYAPLVGVTFDDGVDDDSVTNMPETQTKVIYKNGIAQPADPIRDGYIFAGWYADPELTIPVDFSEGFTKNWNILYAAWNVDVPVEPQGPDDPEDPKDPDQPDTPDTPDQPDTPAVTPGDNSGTTTVASAAEEQTVSETQESNLPQSGDRTAGIALASMASALVAAFVAFVARKRRRS